MIEIYHKRISEKKLQKLNEFQTDSLIYVYNPKEEEIDLLNKNFSLDKRMIKDALDPHEMPRIELKKGIIYIFTQYPNREENNKIIITPILITIKNDFIIIITHNKSNIITFLLKKIDGLSTVQKTKLTLQIFLIINQEYFNFFTEINKEIKSISINLENIKNKNIIQFISFEEVFSNFIDSLVLINANFRNILSKKFLDLYEEDKELIENLHLNSDQLISTCETNLRNIINIRKAYSTIMTNNLNQSVKFLTMLTAFIAIPTLVTSFYGMNVHLPFENFKTISFYIIFLSIIFSGAILFFFIKKKLF